ncbi:hypothetical protein SDC9_170598 [bioreactor metagenome]|uniref:Uncharacterized protein n=1 Tax=bioreactor metagenome TaxID=1076179 RepID=A0A645GAZ7_9ZZZZ
MGHTELRIITAFDGDGVVELPPQAAAVKLSFAGSVQLKIVGRYDDTFPPRLVEECFLMDTVVEKEGFTGKSCAEVISQKREDPVFGFNFSRQQPALVGKAYKALEVLDFPGKMEHRLSQNIHPVVGKVPHYRRPLFETQHNEVEDSPLTFGQAGEEGVGRQPAGFGADVAFQAGVYPAGDGTVGDHRPLGVERDAHIFRRSKAFGIFAISLALVDAA